MKRSTMLRVMVRVATLFVMFAVWIGSASAQDKAIEKAIVLKGGKVLTISHGVIENGVVVMQGGKIVAVGSADTLIPAGADVRDVTGMTVYPGLIDSETQLGLVEISAEKMTVDTSEPSDEIMPHMHVYDAFHAESELIPVTRMNGITNVIVAPEGEDTLPGQDAFVQLAGRSAEEMLLIRDIAMPMNFGPDQRRRGGRGGGGGKYPSTRMGLITQMRQTFLDAQDYQQKWADYEKKKAEFAAKDSAKDASKNVSKDGKGKDTKEKDSPKDPPSPPKRDLKLEALVPYLEGKKPVILHTEDASDVQTAVRMANEFHLKLVLAGLTQAQPVLDWIAEQKLPVIVGSIYNDPKQHTRYDSVFTLPAELYKRGVKIAFASYDAHNVRNLPYAAGYAVAFGLPHDEALKAITLNPAEIWGVADQYGSLDAGKVASVVVADGDPLELRTDVKHLYIRGREIPLTSKQTRLRDQYSQ